MKTKSKAKKSLSNKSNKKVKVSLNKKTVTKVIKPLVVKKKKDTIKKTKIDKTKKGVSKVEPKLKSTKTAKAKPIIKKQVSKVIKVKIAKKIIPDIKSKQTKSESKTIDKKALKAINSLKEKETKVKSIESVKPFKDRPKRGKGGRKRKNKGDDDEPEILHDELVEQLISQTKKMKQPKVPKILKTFVNPMTSLTVAQPENASKKSSTPKKEPKGKFELEYVVHSSSGILYEFLTTPSGLSEWFADDVNILDGVFTFIWDGSEQKALLLAFKEEKFIRFRWMDKPEGYFFEFRIEKDDLTGDISLVIIDFADEASDLETSRRLWDSQVNKLLHVLGSY